MSGYPHLTQYFDVLDFIIIKKDIKNIQEDLWRRDQKFHLIPYEDENGDLKSLHKISDLELFIRLGEMNEDSRTYLKIWLQLYRKFPERFRPKEVEKSQQKSGIKELFRREDLILKASEFNQFKLLLNNRK